MFLEIVNVWNIGIFYCVTTLMSCTLPLTYTLTYTYIHYLHYQGITMEISPWASLCYPFGLM